MKLWARCAHGQKWEDVGCIVRYGKPKCYLAFDIESVFQSLILDLY